MQFPVVLPGASQDVKEVNICCKVYGPHVAEAARISELLWDVFYPEHQLEEVPFLL